MEFQRRIDGESTRMSPLGSFPMSNEDRLKYQLGSVNIGLDQLIQLGSVNIGLDQLIFVWIS